MAIVNELTFPDEAVIRVTLPKKHKFQVMQVALSNDCHYAVFAIKATGPQWPNAQARLHLFDLTGPTELWQCDHPDNEINLLAITPDNQQIISSGFSDTRFFQLSDGQQLRTIDQEGRRFLHIAFAADGKHILCDNGNDPCTAQYLDLAALQPIKQFIGHKKSVYGVAFMPNGKEVITSSADKTIKLWDLNTGNELRYFVGHKKEIFTVAPLHNGSGIISGSCDKTIKLWDVATSKELRTFIGHANYVRSVAISHDDRLILSGSNDMSPRLWDINNSNPILCWGDPEAFVPLVKFSPNSQHVFFADLKGHVWIYRNRH